MVARLTLIAAAFPACARGRDPCDVGQRDPRSDRPARAAGRRCGCWPTSPFLFSGIVVGRFRFGATMELGRSGRSMMMSAAARRRAQRGQLRGHRNRSEICSTISRIGRVNAHSLLPFHARARGRDSSASVSGSDPRCRPTGSSRCGAAAAGRRRHFFLAELLLADSVRGDDGARAIGAIDDDAAAARRRAQRGSATGSSQQAASERSAECGRVNAYSLSFTRAREGAIQRRLSASDRDQTDRLGRCGAAAAGRRRHFFLAELLLADSGSGRRWSSGDRGERDDAAAAGGRAARSATGSSQQVGKICSTDSGAR